MLTEQQKAAIQAASLVLQMAGVVPWFEARIIRDSDKKLNGKRISSKKRTDLESVLKVVEEKRVNMRPDMRMELRMYATVASSRSVIMGQEIVTDLKPRGVVVTNELVAQLEAEEAVIGVDMARPGDDNTVLAVRRGDRLLDLKEMVKSGAISDAEAAMRIGLANYSPAKNVERLKAEGAPEHLVRQAQDRHKPGPDLANMAALIMGKPHTDVLTFPARPDQLPELRPGNPDAPLRHTRVVAEHTHDTLGPMMQKEDGGPFLSTCSLCGDFS